MKKYILYSLCCALLSASMFGAQIKKKPVVKKTTVTPKKKAAEAAKAKIQPKTGTKATKPAAKKDKPKAGPGAGTPVPPPVPAWSQAGAGAPPLPPIPTDEFTNFLSIIAAGDVRSAQQLLQDNPEFALLADKKTGDTALIIAARAGNREMIRLLIQSGADLNHKNNQNMDAIDVARPEIRDALISASGIMPPSAEPTPYAGPGAPPAARPERKREIAQMPPPIPAWEPTGTAAGAGAGAGTPPPIPAWEPEPTKTTGPSAARTHKGTIDDLIRYAREENFERMTPLIDNNPNLLQEKNEKGETALMAATRSTNIDVVKFLIAQIKKHFAGKKAYSILVTQNSDEEDVIVIAAKLVGNEKAKPGVRKRAQEIYNILNLEYYDLKGGAESGAAVGAGAETPPAIPTPKATEPSEENPATEQEIKDALAQVDIFKDRGTGILKRIQDLYKQAEATEQSMNATYTALMTKDLPTRSLIGPKDRDNLEEKLQKLDLAKTRFNTLVNVIKDNLRQIDEVIYNITNKGMSSRSLKVFLADAEKSYTRITELEKQAYAEDKKVNDLRQSFVSNLYEIKRAIFEKLTNDIYDEIKKLGAWKATFEKIANVDQRTAYRDAENKLLAKINAMADTKKQAIAREFFVAAKDFRTEKIEGTITQISDLIRTIGDPDNELLITQDIESRYELYQRLSTQVYNLDILIKDFLQTHIEQYNEKIAKLEELI